MRSRFLALLCVAAGCAAQPHPRLLRIVGGDAAADDSASGPTRWVPPADTAVPNAVSSVCGGEDGAIDWSAGAGGHAPASVAWCVRISPDEPTTSAPTCTTGDSGLQGGGEDGEPPPCGFFNLVGALSGAQVAAPLVFCDHDPSGGLRLAWISEAGEVAEQLVAEGDCIADPDSGGLVATDDGWLATWLTAGTGEDGNIDPGARFVRLAADATTEPPRPSRAGLEGLGTQLHLVPGDPLLAWSRDPAGTVILSSLSSTDLSLVAPPVPFAVEIASLAVARDAERGSLAVLCSRTGAVSLRRVLPDGRADPPESLSLSCDGTTRLSVALQPDGRAALGVDDGDRGVLVFLSPEGEQTGSLVLGEGARFVQVVSRTDGWLVLDSTGLLRSVDLDGALRTTLALPQVAQAQGSIVSLRLGATGGSARVVVLGQQSVDLGFGHVNTYNTVEISHVSLEAL